MIVSILFILTIGIMVAVSVAFSHHVVNAFSVFAVPYFVIVPLNQFVAVPLFGFYWIRDDTLVMIWAALAAFFIGYVLVITLVPFLQRNARHERDIKQLPVRMRLEAYNMRPMAWFVLVLGVLFIIRVVYSIVSGNFDASQFDASTDEFTEGVFAHVNIIISALAPLLALHAVEHKDKWSIAAVLMAFVCSFTTFHKYNVLGLLVATVLFIAMNRKKHIWYLGVILVVLTAVFFVGNYFIGFVARSMDINPLFYLRHFFEYSTGSVVYDNYIFTSGIGAEGSFFEKLLIIAFAFPNMFIYRVVGYSMFPYEIQVRKLISSTGESTNLNDAIGFLFPLSGDLLEILGFVMFFIVVGAMFGSIMHQLEKAHAQRFSLVYPVLLTYFLFFSFFGSFYVLSGPWELLVWSAVMPRLFRKGAFWKPRKCIEHITHRPQSEQASEAS